MIKLISRYQPLLHRGNKAATTSLMRIISTTANSSCNSVVEVLDHMQQQQSSQTKSEIYASLLQQCGNANALSDGKCVHEHILRNGLGHDRLLMNLLVEMYGKCGNLDEATAVFRAIPNPNAFSWTIIIVAYAQNGHHLKATNLFRRMELEGIKPTLVTCASVVAVCASMGALEEGKAMHSRIIASGFVTNSIVQNSLVNMYAKCGRLEHARALFERMRSRDVIAWTSMVAGYAEHGHYKEAIMFFRKMELEGVKPNDITYTDVLDACSNLCDLAEGRRAHLKIVESEIHVDGAIATALISMYGKCQSVKDAKMVFDNLGRTDLISCNAMISVFVQHGHGKEALNLFHRMKSEGIVPNAATYARVLNACSDSGALAEGKAIHADIVASGLEKDVIVETALIGMYISCGSFQNAVDMFERMEVRDMVSWTAMIAAYAEQGQGREALRLFRHTCLEGLELNRITLVSVVDACATVEAFKEGKKIHEMIVSLGYSLDVVLGSVLVNFYGKCGNVTDGRRVFDSLAQKDIVCWNAMIARYAQHGYYKEAIELFMQALLEAVKPSDISFLCVLFACSHVGQLQDGWQQFVSMSADHGIVPSDEHFRCMIDLLGRAGHLEKAEELINTMPFEPVRVTWTMLLGACRVHKDVVRGTRLAKQIVLDKEEDAAAYVLLSNIYAEAGRGGDQSQHAHDQSRSMFHSHEHVLDQTPNLSRSQQAILSLKEN